MPQPSPHPFPSLPRSEDALVRQLHDQASALWGPDRAQRLSEMLQQHARHLLALDDTLPPSPEFPTMMWQNHP